MKSIGNFKIIESIYSYTALDLVKDIINLDVGGVVNDVLTGPEPSAEIYKNDLGGGGKLNCFRIQSSQNLILLYTQIL